MGLYLIHPAQARTSSYSFANWLETVVKKERAAHIQQQIFELKESDASLASLIEKASEMVSRNNDDFNLPIGDETSNTDEVYNLLIVEWNSYQTGNGMGKASNPKALKSNLHFSVDKFAHSLGGKVDRKNDSAYGFFGEVGGISRTDVCNYIIEPLSGGIAIGAP